MMHAGTSPGVEKLKVHIIQAHIELFLNTEKLYTRNLYFSINAIFRNQFNVNNVKYNIRKKEKKQCNGVILVMH